MMISSKEKIKHPLLKKKELPKKVKDTVLPLKKEQIDIKRVKYFLKHIVTAHIKISERDEAKEELKSHLERLRDIPGIGKTVRIDEALQELEKKIHNSLQKEKELIIGNKVETTRVNSLTKEAEHLRKRIRELEEKIIKKEEKPKKTIKNVRSVLRLDKQIKKLENIYNKFKKIKKHQKETKIIQSKLKVLRDRLKKAKF